jgi:putative ABC transport system permease protein
MGGGCSGQGIKKYGSPGSFLSINQYRVNPGFCKTMQLELLDGRYFTTSEADKKAVILNEAAVKLLGLKTGSGEQVQMNDTPLHVIAVVKDFYYTDHPGEPIAPLVISQQQNNYLNNFYVRTGSDLTKTQLSQIEAVFKSYSPDYIVAHSQLTDVYANKYKNEERIIKLVSSGAVLAILISLIGLTALSVLNVNRRTKEIGIRKVVGSTETQVVKSLLGETFVLVAISVAIAYIFSYIALQQWLINFAKHIELSLIYFLAAGLLAFIIAFIAVAWQSWRAATSNPVEALRYE